MKDLDILGVLGTQKTVFFQEPPIEYVQKIHILEKKLKIVTKALKGVSLWANTGNGGEKAVKKICEKALKEMEGVK